MEAFRARQTARLAQGCLPAACCDYSKGDVGLKEARRRSWGLSGKEALQRCRSWQELPAAFVEQ